MLSDDEIRKMIRDLKNGIRDFRRKIQERRSGDMTDKTWNEIRILQRSIQENETEIEYYENRLSGT